MANINLTDNELKVLSECINNQTEIPEDLLLKLSPGFFDKLRHAGKFDYKELDKYKIPTIDYAGKRPEAVILAQAAITGGAAPLQFIRSFANGKNGNWKNLIVQGDNLQFLKTCYMNQDPLIKDEIKGKIKLIYIDPPFATKSDFIGKDGETSYSDKIERAEFIESLRERLIFLRELLAGDGSIYVHLDSKMSHYIKIIMDEIFGSSNFRNSIIWKRTSAHNDPGRYGIIDDTILFYTKTDNWQWNDPKTEYEDWYVERYYKYIEEGTGKRFLSRDITAPAHGGKSGQFKWKGISPSKGRMWAYTKENMEELDRQSKLFYTSNGIPRLKQYLDEMEGTTLQTIWDDILPIVSWSTEGYNYPTQKPLMLLERIIEASTSEGDLILDCFAGSGTTAVAAEKFGRRWIMCDFGKHAIYTMQKRILSIEDSKNLGGDMGKDNTYGQSPKPFCVVSAGAYDFSKIMNLRKNKDAYVSFVLGLFGISREDVDFSKKYKLSNIYAEKENNPVEVYPVWEDEYLKDVRIDEDYFKDVMKASGDKLKGDYYIVVPETCTVISDTILKNKNNEKVNFKLLKFPYKVLEDVSRHFQIEEQASSSADINKLISSAGFYFNEEVKIELEKSRGGFKIAKFKTEILDKNKERFKGLDGLSMLLVDVDYDGEIFDMDVAIYSSEIDKEGFVKVEGLTKDSHLIAIDKHGNESKITKIS